MRRRPVGSSAPMPPHAGATPATLPPRFSPAHLHRLARSDTKAHAMLPHSGRRERTSAPATELGTCRLRRRMPARFSQTQPRTRRISSALSGEHATFSQRCRVPSAPTSAQALHTHMHRRRSFSPSGSLQAPGGVRLKVAARGFSAVGALVALLWQQQEWAEGGRQGGGKAKQHVCPGASAPAAACHGWHSWRGCVTRAASGGRTEAALGGLTVCSR